MKVLCLLSATYWEVKWKYIRWKRSPKAAVAIWLPRESTGLCLDGNHDSAGRRRNIEVRWAPGKVGGRPGQAATRKRTNRWLICPSICGLLLSFPKRWWYWFSGLGLRVPTRLTDACMKQLVTSKTQNQLINKRFKICICLLMFCHCAEFLWSGEKRGEGKSRTSLKRDRGVMRWYKTGFTAACIQTWAAFKHSHQQFLQFRDSP